MTNISSNLSSDISPRFGQPDWIASEVINLLAITSVLWIGVSFIKWNRLKSTQPQLPTERGASKVNSSLAAAIAFAFLRLICSQVAFNIGYSHIASSQCDVIVDLSVVFYAFFYLGYYLVLWFRLHFLYENIARVHALGAWAARVKYMSLLVIGSGNIVVSALYAYHERCWSSPIGCASTNEETPHWLLYTALVLVFFAQGLMIFQFVYPLRFQQSGKTAGAVMRIAKRSAAIASLCIVTDLVTTLLDQHLVASYSLYLSLTIFDVNMLVNLFCVLLTFKSWQKILTCLFRK